MSSSRYSLYSTTSRVDISFVRRLSRVWERKERFNDHMKQWSLMKMPDSKMLSTKIIIVPFVWMFLKNQWCVNETNITSAISASPNIWRTPRHAQLVWTNWLQKHCVNRQESWQVICLILKSVATIFKEDAVTLFGWKTSRLTLKVVVFLP